MGPFLIRDPLLGHAVLVWVRKKCAGGNFFGPREPLYVGGVRELKLPEQQSIGLELGEGGHTRDAITGRGGGTAVRGARIS